MDEAEAILLSSLRSSGVLLPPDFSTSSTLQDLSPDALISICVQSLHLIIGATASPLPTSLPDSAADRFQVCEDISAAIKSAGYMDEISFRQVITLLWLCILRSPAGDAIVHLLKTKSFCLNSRNSR